MRLHSGKAKWDYTVVKLSETAPPCLTVEVWVAALIETTQWQSKLRLHPAACPLSGKVKRDRTTQHDHGGLTQSSEAKWDCPPHPSCPLSGEVKQDCTSQHDCGGLSYKVKRDCTPQYKCGGLSGKAKWDCAPMHIGNWSDQRHFTRSQSLEISESKWYLHGTSTHPF